MFRDRKTPPSWIFAITNLPFGLYFGIVVTVLPYLLRLRGTPPEESSVIVSLGGVPACLYGLWAAVVDRFFPRNVWLILASTFAGLLAALSLRLAASSQPPVGLIAAFAILGGCAVVLVSTANAGLIAQLMPKEAHTKTAGWLEAGNLAGGAIGAAGALWLARRYAGSVVWVASAAIALPSLVALVYRDPRRGKTSSPSSGRAPGLFQLLARPKLRFGLLVAVCPVGAAAVANLFSAIAPDYRASENAVIWVTGFFSNMLATASCIATGYFISRYNPVIAYLSFGASIAILSAIVFFSPMVPATYIAGNTVYVLLTGCINSAFSAMALHLTAGDPATTGRGYSLLAGASNLAIVYMTFIDGQGARWIRGRGVFGVDALITGTAALIVLLLWRRISLAAGHERLRPGTA